jgi:hypothetical protein
VRIADDWHLLSFAVKDDKLRRFIDGALVDDKEGIMDDHDGKDLNDDQDDELEESDPRRLNEEVTIAKEGRDAAEDRRDA